MGRRSEPLVPTVCSARIDSLPVGAGLNFPVSRERPIEDDDVGTLTWAELSPPVLDPVAELLLYDDRGLGVIATSRVPLLPLYKQFGNRINRVNLSP